MKRNSILFLLSVLLLTISQSNSFAQKDKYRDKANDPVARLDYDKKLRWTDGLFKAGSYYNAVEYYKQLLMEQPRNPYIVYQIAECSWFMRDYPEAARMYGYAYDLASGLYPEAKYKEAQMLKMDGQYENAIEAFNQFIDNNPKGYKKTKAKARVGIEGCKMAINSMKDPIPANVINLGPNINSPYTELSPMPLGDTALLFATMKVGIGEDVLETDRPKRSDYVSRFMVSHKFKQTEIDVRDTFQWPLQFEDGKFNDPKYHVGNGVYSPGGERFYFTKCIETKNNEINCRIFVSEFDKKEWSKPVELGFGINESGSSSTQPFIAKVGKQEVLYFSSNRKLQSRGGYDIWYSVYNERQKTYRRPQNAGKYINTDGDEVAPYYDSKTGTLYFASNGWVSLGGFDIFSAKGGPSRYTDKANLGYPINTSADELYYIKDPVGKGDAYIVSNRVGSIALKNPTCCDDIWRVQYEPKLMVQGEVINKKTKKPVTEAVVKMVNEQGDLKTFNSEDGKFEFSLNRGHNYEISADKMGFVTETESVSTQGVKRSDPDETVKVIIYVDSFYIDQDFALNDILYDYDKASLRPESTASLEKLRKLMKDNPSIDVQIYSYTDSKGTDAYNMTLSQERAQSVVNYLISHGIDRSRLSAKGMGKENPIAPNTINGKDNPSGRQMNRRTTFRILTDVPSRRVIYDSSKPGTIGSQSKNLEVNDNPDYDTNPDGDDPFSEPGSRVN